MKEIIVDTSVWIEALKGKNFPLLEEALKGGRVSLPPIVLSELLSGTKSEKEGKKLTKFLSYIPLHPVGRAHWKNVGLLRSFLSAKGFNTSIPDCHIAQCALECEGLLLSHDKIFKKIASLIQLNIAEE